LNDGVRREAAVTVTLKQKPAERCDGAFWRMGQSELRDPGSRLNEVR
jgi:hypothetical protein